MKRGDLQSRYRQWLDSADPSTDRILACKRHHAGTSARFLEGPVSEAWIKAGSLMWIHSKRF
ncbi:hypothetical protein BC834DRAFT_888434 [Gloeopeniophorella convolvens]|nr:hypothetical protein BC834DRAFT_888434 [Gloeopeniophorella convolvens]